ncbi:MAG: ErfK/YbiS/YcfS/YnhG family protein [Acidimicrobiaceae bacterium]|nr:ErfK/YbiS/YcfS/YnhG family protein [Acidimicrobiaceae bacterium]
MSPASGTRNVSGSGPIKITFSGPISKRTAFPTLSPNVPGRWAVSGTDALTFTPSQPFVPLAQVTVTVPAGSAGVRGSGGAELGSAVKDTFSVKDGSVLRLQQLLSLLEYSPLAWAPSVGAVAPTDTAGQLAAMYSPPTGHFSWRQTGWPVQLRALWQPGRYSLMTRGLVMEFQADHGLNVNGNLGPGLWNDLLQVVESGQVNTGGYNYALANKTAPESLTIWHNAKVVARDAANTGIAQDPTPSGNFAVYARYRSQVMHGTNPNGSKYADPVQYVAYFHDGDAVHYLARADYGIPQSLGCIELPLAQAASVWPYLAYGTLVSVIG